MIGSAYFVTMAWRSDDRWTAWFRAIFLACAWLLFTSAPGCSAAAPTLAVTSPSYVDTSGEPRDQVADHARRVKLFADLLRANLATSGKFRITPLDCQPSPCTAATSDPAQLMAEAKQGGVDYLLIGGIHKMSTLVQWAKFDILDVSTQNVVFSRLLTFRGDDDAAWKNAETFLEREILQQDVFKQPPRTQIFQGLASTTAPADLTITLPPWPFARRSSRSHKIRASTFAEALLARCYADTSCHPVRRPAVRTNLAQETRC